jgi:poly-beta-1,6-N-acetyl-D-glucosamine synthase
MTEPRLTYAVITPVRNEQENIPRLHESIAGQSQLPERWVIVDTGSTDATLELVWTLATACSWVSVLECPVPELQRGGPIVRAFHVGLDGLGAERPDVIVKVDADVSLEPDHFARLLRAFAADPLLGIASGSAWELRDSVWTQLFGTRTSVWGAARAYRRECLAEITPLEERMGWDGVDELKANVQGWTTKTLLDLPFLHHRLEGGRDRSRWAAWAAQGEVAHFMGYRVSYLVARALYRTLREPAAAGMVAGYVRSSAGRRPTLSDPAARAFLRDRQRWRELPLRVGEALGRGSRPRR